LKLNQRFNLSHFGTFEEVLLALVEVLVDGAWTWNFHLFWIRWIASE